PLRVSAEACGNLHAWASLRCSLVLLTCNAGSRAVFMSMVLIDGSATAPHCRHGRSVTRLRLWPATVAFACPWHRRGVIWWMGLALHASLRCCSTVPLCLFGQRAGLALPTRD